MTNRYDELRAAAEAATPGPWVAYNRNMSDFDDDFLGWDFKYGEGPPEAGIGVLLGPDMRFVVLARRDVLALLSERDSLLAALRDYHFALDSREHGGVAADRLVKAVEGVFGHWVQGAEKARRASREIQS